MARQTEDDHESHQLFIIFDLRLIQVGTKSLIWDARSLMCSLSCDDMYLLNRCFLEFGTPKDFAPETFADVSTSFII